MTGWIGADPIALDALGQQLLEQADQLEQARLRLSAELYEISWDGADADGTLAEWESQHGPALGSAGELLRVMSSSLFAQAVQQRAASSGEGEMGSGHYARAPLGSPVPYGDPEALQDYWLSVAADRAGIDMSTWDPSLGSGALKDTITDVYTYYGGLFTDNPYMQWAGMANMVGPAFAAGFFDLDMFRDLAQALEGQPGVPPGMGALAHLTDEELKFYETTFLTMQKEIFEDQAMMHEAYLGGGLDAIRDLGDAGLIDPQTVRAWEQIDEGQRTGNDDLIAQGNEALLLREQRDIIDRYYQQMYDHDVTGPAFTYLMTAVGEVSIPGAQSFGDYKPLVVTMETPGPENIPFTPWDNPVQGEVHVRTPFPDGNIAIFDDRWDYITNDTLPAYQELLHDHPDRAHEIITSDVGDRIEEYRIYNRIDTLLEHYSRDWGVDVDQ